MEEVCLRCHAKYYLAFNYRSHVSETVTMPFALQHLMHDQRLHTLKVADRGVSLLTPPA